MNSPEQKKPRSPPTIEQQMFMKNILLPKKPLSEDESLMKEKTLEELTKNKEKNTLNIIHGENIAEYKEYLQARCNKLCLFKTRPDIQPFYKRNGKVKEYINKNCQDCIRTLREFNRALDIAIENILGIDPSSPTANFNLIFILIKNGKAIFDALPLKFRKELEKFEPLDGGDIQANKYSLLNELEINLKGFIKRSEIARRRALLSRANRTRRGGRKTKKKKRRKKKKKRKRKTKRKKRYKN